MDHFTVVTDQLDHTRAFYEMLGLRVGPRPDFGIGGLWLYAEDRAVLHVVEQAAMPALRRGVLDHMAFWARASPPRSNCCSAGASPTG